MLEEAGTERQQLMKLIEQVRLERRSQEGMDALDQRLGPFFLDRRRWCPATAGREIYRSIMDMQRSKPAGCDRVVSGLLPSGEEKNDQASCKT